MGENGEGGGRWEGMGRVVEDGREWGGRWEMGENGEGGGREESGGHLNTRRKLMLYSWRWATRRWERVPLSAPSF